MHATTKHDAPTDAWAPKLALSPEPGAWAGLSRSHERPAAAARFREQLGLGDGASGAVVMSGHQAEIWHAGILTKMLALRGVAGAAAARSAWVVVDQDANEPGIIRYPTGLGGTLAATEWRISATDARTTDVPIAARGVFTAAQLEPRWGEKPAATGAVACGLGAIRDAMLNAARAGDLAGQMIAATRELLGAGRDADVWVRATAISRTDLFAELVERMKQDPAACVAAYNAAAARHAGAGIAPLNAARGELPLWRIRPDAARGRVNAANLAGIPVHELAPRALMMTGMLRYAGCDLFIHGLGGGKYDVIAEEWLASWLAWRLAPAVVATGTLLAKLSDSPPPSPEALARARWSLHHARHTPATLGDSWSQKRKEELLDEIRGIGARGGNTYRPFAALQDLLSRVRVEHQDVLTGLSREVGSLEARVKESKVALDRTWAFPLHEPGSLTALEALVARAFAGGR